MTMKKGWQYHIYQVVRLTYFSMKLISIGGWGPKVRKTNLNLLEDYSRIQEDFFKRPYAIP